MLRDARSLGRDEVEPLPHDLSGPSRFAAWPLRALATQPPGTGDPLAAATRVFLDAIEKPLALAEPSPPAPLPARPPTDRGEGGRKKARTKGGDSGLPLSPVGRVEGRERRIEGVRVFPWAFAPGHAERLARAFAEARLARPEAPLVPELQVVLAHLLELAGEPVGGETVVVEVPDDPAELVDRALEEHLRRSLEGAFPHGVDPTARTRALLVLRELADVHGRREQGRAADALASALGEEGHEVLEKLSTPRTRIVLRERRGDAQVWVLAHDRLAEVLVQVVDDGGWAGLGIDAELLGLRRFVTLQSQLYASGDVAQATAVPARYFGKIATHREVLLWSDAHRAWWRACQTRRRRERRRQLVRWAVAAAVLVLVGLGAWTLAERRAQRRALLDEVATGEPEAAFAALDVLTRSERDPEELLASLRQREKPFDVFERGLGGVSAERRAEALLRAAELALPMLEASPEDPVRIASLVWALDFFAGPDPVLRDRALAALRKSHPPPPLPEPGDLNWVSIPAGTFWMGAAPEDGRDEPDMQIEQPRHQVTVSAFRIMTHEVTNAEVRRLFPGHKGADELPATERSWYDAYTYAAWLGGRLPTEAEWERAARLGCAHTYCKRDGSAATVDAVAWWMGNSADPQTGALATQPVMQLEPSPSGLWDLQGNAFEWTADWLDAYPESAVEDPAGPTSVPLGYRSFRSGACLVLKKWTPVSARSGVSPDYLYVIGLRVVLPAAK